MDKDLVITSRFSIFRSIVAAVIYIAYCFAIYKVIALTAKDESDTQPVAFLAMLMVLLALRFIYPGPIKKIIVNPDTLTVVYFITNHTIVIPLIEISAIKNSRMTNHKTGVSNGLREQRIISDQGNIYFHELYFSNYDQLKNAIYNYTAAAKRNIKS